MTTGGTTLKNFIWNRFTRFVDAISQAHTFHAHFSLLFTIGAMTFATALSLFFHQITPTGSANIALIYILTIIMISYHTDKYRYGIISGIISVFFINYMFTYPFGQFSFSTAGYPFTFAVMYFISILSSATVFRMKDQAQKINETEKLLAEAEKEKKIKEAEGQAEAIRAVQRATADGIRYIKEAGADQAVLQLKSLEAFQAAADGKANKIIIPSDIQGIAGLVKSISESAAKEDTK